MINISEAALSVLSESLQASGVERGLGLRLKEENQRLTLYLSKPEKGDRIISRDGQSVLIIDPGFETFIGDAFIDVEDTGEGSEIIMRSNK